jgi:hypothetical protein
LFLFAGHFGKPSAKEKLLGLLHQQDQEEVPQQETPEQVTRATDDVMHEASESSSKEEVGEDGVSSHMSPTI